MAAIGTRASSPLATDVLRGLGGPGPNRLPARYFYDDLGSALFHAITLLPEYGLSRADDRLLQQHALELGGLLTQSVSVIELGSGNGKKTSAVLQAVREHQPTVPIYHPIDVSAAALDACQHELAALADVRPVLGEYVEGLSKAVATRVPGGQLLVLFLGSTIGNFDRDQIPGFLIEVRRLLQAGDLFLLGADLVKPVEVMLAAYDDPQGVTAAFNLNLLGRLNRELSANFDLRAFRHEARWNEAERRIEMHLVSTRRQSVLIADLDMTVSFTRGESIWTESSHKFLRQELDSFARVAGFAPLRVWVDDEWPFAEALWRVL